MSKKNIISEYLSDESLDLIASAIEKIEKQTSGEIRVCVKKNRGILERKNTPREIALKEFLKLNMNNTKDRTGVLFFILLNERKFEIVADEGINSKIPAGQWEVISSEVIHHFSNNKYTDGILCCLGKIGEVLIKEFPVESDDKDELSNEVIIN
jgi:uncharacterized membrane protein